MAVRLRRTALRCSVFGASHPTHFAHCVHCAQTNGAKSDVEGAVAPAPKPCAPRRHPRGPKSQHRPTPAGRGSFRGLGLFAKRTTLCSWGPCEPSSSAGLCSSVRSTPRGLTSRSCLSAVNEVNAASSARAAMTEQRRAVAPRATGERGRLSFGGRFQRPSATMGWIST